MTLTDYLIRLGVPPDEVAAMTTRQRVERIRDLTPDPHAKRQPEESAA